jgi:serine/threonine-protein kinase RsbW
VDERCARVRIESRTEGKAHAIGDGHVISVRPSGWGLSPVRQLAGGHGTLSRRRPCGWNDDVALAWNANPPGSATSGVGRRAPKPLLDTDYRAVPESCPQARHAVRAALDGLAVDLAAVELAVSEAVANAVLHAYRDHGPDEPPGRISVSVSVESTYVRIVVADEGVGMRPRDDSPGLGLGLSVIAKVCDELLIVQGHVGTRVHMRFVCGAVASGGRGVGD